MIERILIALIERWTGKIVFLIGEKIEDAQDNIEINKLAKQVELTTKAFELEPNETNKKNLIDSARKLATSFEL